MCYIKVVLSDIPNEDIDISDSWELWAIDKPDRLCFWDDSVDDSVDEMISEMTKETTNIETATLATEPTSLSHRRKLPNVLLVI